jgi:integrase/recombinase XerD
LKEKAMAKTHPVTVSPGRYRPSDDLIAFLERL